MKKSAILIGIAVAAISCQEGELDQANLSSYSVAVTHIEKFSQIAKDNGGNRYAGTKGYNDSLAYVRGLLEPHYDIKLHEFKYPDFEEVTGPAVSKTSPDTKDIPKDQYTTMTFSSSGDLKGIDIVPVDVVMPPAKEPNTSTSGCDAEDFVKDGKSIVEGKIALVQRGSCAFGLKATNAFDAKAVGVIIYNEGNPDHPTRIETITDGNLGEVLAIPVLGSSFALGKELNDDFNAGKNPKISLSLETKNTFLDTANLLAESKEGDADKVVMVGANLGSAKTSPGMNSNAAGSAAVIEAALALSKSAEKPVNKVRFSFWGGDLTGSSYYTKGLSKEDAAKIQIYVNFERIASKNFARFVFDSVGTPKGSSVAEKYFDEFYKSKTLTTEKMAGDNGDSDHFWFSEIGIPVGGITTGGIVKKTEAQAKVFGGKAGEPYDACEDKACDDATNIDKTIFGQSVASAVFIADKLATHKGVIRETPFDSQKDPAQIVKIGGGTIK